MTIFLRWEEGFRVGMVSVIGARISEICYYGCQYLVTDVANA